MKSLPPVALVGQKSLARVGLRNLHQRVAATKPQIGELGNDYYAVGKPQFWTGTPPIDPALVTIDARNLTEGELDRRMNETYDEFGLVNVKNTGITEMTEMEPIVRNVIKEVINYEAGANPRNHIVPNVYDIGAPISADLHYHHEMAYVGAAPANISFSCIKAPHAGNGRTFVSDNIKATDHMLTTEFGQKLIEKGLCYHRDLTNREHFRGREEVGVYNHWQQSMSTEDPDVAEAIAQSKNLETEWGPNGLLKTRFYVSAYEFFPQLNRNLLFSSVADHSMWFDSYPMVMHLPQDQRPLDLTFGDLTPMTKEELVFFMELYDLYGMPIDWNVGDIAVVCNTRWLHGRPGITLAENEERELGVVLGATFERLGDIDGKW